MSEKKTVGTLLKAGITAGVAAHRNRRESPKCTGKMVTRGGVWRYCNKPLSANEIEAGVCSRVHTWTPRKSA